MKNALTKGISLVMVMALLMMALAGCGTNPTGAQQTTAAAAADAGAGGAAAKDHLTVLVIVEPPSLFPGSFPSTGNPQTLIGNLYDTLVYEANGDRTTLLPGLASSWEFNEDGTVLTMEIRDGVKFHDGSELTAEDVAFSLNIDRDQAYNANFTSILEGFEVVDEKHVAVKLSYAYKPVLSILAMPSFSIFSKAWYEKCQAEGTNLDRTEMGTGPYKLASWTSGESLEYEAFEDWWGGDVAIKKVTVKIYGDATTAGLAMEQGEGELFFGASTADCARLDAKDGITVVYVPSNGTHYITYNMNPEYGSIFMDKNARKAAQAAINRDEILLGGLDGIGWVTPYMVNMGHFGYIEDFEPAPYDPEKAKEYLAASGYDGSPVIFKAANSSWYQLPAQVKQEQLRTVGFNVDLQIQERATIDDEARTKFDCDMFNWMTWGAVPDADADVWKFLRTDTRGVAFANVGWAGNEEVDELLEKARYSLDDEERIAIYKQIAEINEEEAWYTFTITGTNTVVVNDSLKGFEPNEGQVYKFSFWSF